MSDAMRSILVDLRVKAPAMKPRRNRKAVMVKVLSVWSFGSGCRLLYLAYKAYITATSYGREARREVTCPLYCTEIRYLLWTVYERVCRPNLLP